MNKKILIFALLVVVATICLSYGCTSNRNEQPIFPATTAKTNDEIRIASFNIQNFGKTKAGKPEIMQVLAEIIRKYDVIAIQEVSDKTETAPRRLLELVNSNQSSYKLSLSERTGKQSNDKTSQEQYAFYYNSKKIEQLGEGILFDDQLSDFFQREPFIARFKVVGGNFTFVLINIHTQPDQAVEEICALDSVIGWAKKIYADEDDFIALGDFNGGCSYASPANLDRCNIRGSNYVWIVPDDADTNLATKRCAYDRMVCTKGIQTDYSGQWGVDKAFTDKSISDHWPVWASFHGNVDKSVLPQ